VAAALVLLAVRTAAAQELDPDGDGVLDERDRCPTEPGFRADGCPEPPVGPGTSAAPERVTEQPGGERQRDQEREGDGRGDGDGGAPREGGTQRGKRLRNRMAARPLTLPDGSVQVDLGLRLAGMGQLPEVTTISTVGFAVADRGFQLDFTFAPILFSPLVEAVDGNAALTYVLVRGETQVGISVAINSTLHEPWPYAPSTYLALGVPLLFRLGQVLRIETGLHGSVSISKPSALGLKLPVTIDLQLTDLVFLRARTGVAALDLRDVGDTGHLPLGGGMGFTWPSSKGPMAEVVLEASYRVFLAPPVLDDRLHPGLFSVGVKTSFFLHEAF
jgi:hypothetical protein